MKKLTLLLCIGSLLISGQLWACSDFRIIARDGSVIIGRSMEFPVDLKSAILVIPRGTAYTAPALRGTPGYSWRTRYGFIAINGENVPDAFMDGFNEKGLSLEGLMFTGAQYQRAVPGKSVPIDMLGALTLGSCASVAEVKALLARITISEAVHKKFRSMGLHVAFHDVHGQSIVVEFISGNIQIHDNPVGVMTNRPDFAWQLNNLRNYINLDARDKKPKMINGLLIEPTGVGSGMLGLPGDWTPPSRFVRLALCLHAARKPANATEAVNLAEHLLNIVDIPKGVIKENPSPVLTLYGHAQWVVIKDLKNLVLYYRTYENTVWRSVALEKFDLVPQAPVRSLQVHEGPSKKPDMSHQFK